MTELLHQLAELFLDAIPTVILVFLFYLFLRASFFRPMERVLTERSARSEGARRAAQSAEAAAQEKWKAYQRALQNARAEIYGEQEAARRKALEARAALVRDARHQANGQIHTAKESIGRELAAVRSQLEAESQALADQIVRTILERPSARPQVARES
jgi:F-type H+-transporting ATPase subunit b